MAHACREWLLSTPRSGKTCMKFLDRRVCGNFAGKKQCRIAKAHAELFPYAVLGQAGCQLEGNPGALSRWPTIRSETRPRFRERHLSRLGSQC
jgi:hypothetical protein